MATETIAQISAGIALLAAAGAWAALFVQRRNATETIRAQVNIGARSSRAAVVSANRQKWIDAVRDDIAEFSSIRSQIAVAKFSRGTQPANRDALATEERELRSKLHMLRARVEMRLNHNEDDHLALLASMDRYSQSAASEDDIDMRTKARCILKAEWTRLKKEASGIEPFVREAVPERK